MAKKQKIYYQDSFEHAIVQGRTSELVCATLTLAHVDFIDTFDETLDVLEHLLDARDRQPEYSHYINTAIVRFLEKNLHGLNSFVDDRAYTLWSRITLDASAYTPDVQKMKLWKSFEAVRDAQGGPEACKMEIQDLILMHHWDSSSWGRVFRTWCEGSTQICELDLLAKIATRARLENRLNDWRKSREKIISAWPFGENDVSLRILPMEDRLIWYIYNDLLYRVDFWKNELDNNMAAKQEFLQAWSYIVSKRNAFSWEEFVADTHDDIMASLLPKSAAPLWDMMSHSSYRSDIHLMQSILSAEEKASAVENNDYQLHLYD